MSPKKHSNNLTLKPSNALPIAYTYHQAAKLLACSRDTVIRMCSDGRLHRIYLSPRAPRIPRWSIENRIRQSYDEHGTTASAQKGEGVWQKSIHVPTRPVGGPRSKTQLVNELDALLASPTKTNSKKKPN